MTYNAQEISVEGGSPVELYEFVMGSDTYYYTSNGSDLTVESVEYTATPISRSSFAVNIEERRDILRITMPSSLAFAERFKSTLPGLRIFVTIKRYHRTDVSEEIIIVYEGVVESISFSTDGQELTTGSSSLTAGLSRQIPRFTYQGLCNHVLFDSNCKVASGSFSYTGEVTAVSGFDITVTGVSSKGASWAVGGFVAKGSDDFRMVIAQSGDDLTLILPFGVTVLNADVDVYAGCDHSIATCKTKFNNIVNYGGFAFVPELNPFVSGI